MYPLFSKIPGFEAVRPVADALAGAGGALASHATNAYGLLRRIPGADKLLPDEAAFSKAIADATPDNTPAHVGKFLEGLAEFAIPAGAAERATAGMGLAARAAAQGAVGGTVSAVQSKGDPVATVAGAGLGAAGPVLAGAAGAAARKMAPALYQSALKPTWAMARKQGLQMIDTGLGLEIPVSGEGAATLDSHIDDLRKAITEGIDNHAAAGREVDAHEVLKSLDGLKDWARNTLDPQKKLEAIQALEDNFIAAHGSRLPIDKAQALKVNTYRELKNAYGEMSAVETEAKKQIARGLKEQISQVFPEIASLNEQQSKALGLDEALARAVWRIDNKEMLGIGIPIAVTAGKEALGKPGGWAMLAGKLLLDNPTLKSKLAIALGKAGTQNATGTVAARLAALLGGGALQEGGVSILGRSSEAPGQWSPAMSQ